MATKKKSKSKPSEIMKRRLEAKLQYNEALLKDIEQTYRSKIANAAEAALAETTLYKTWYEFLKAYLEAQREFRTGEVDDSDPAVEKNISAFGDLSLGFRPWWTRFGRQLFVEREQLPIIQIIEMDEQWQNGEYPAFITLRIPLTISPEGIRAQLEDLLEVCQPKRVMAHAGSSARKALHPRKAYHRQQYRDCLAIWKHRRLKPNAPLWKIGHEQGLCPLKDPYSKDSFHAADAKKQLHSATDKKLKQAERLMYHAVRGKFPCEEKIKQKKSIKRK